MTTTADELAHELSRRLLPHLRRADAPVTFSSLTHDLAVFERKMRDALNILIGEGLVDERRVQGKTVYSAKVIGERTPGRLTLNMTSIYRLPQALIEQSKRCEAAREIDSRF